MPRELTYLNETVNISGEEVAYWKRMINSNLKIGVEIECCYGRSHGESSIRSAMRSEFSPTGNTCTFGKCGVYEVKSDGSLNNGVELCTVGRRLDFLDLYEQYKYITNYMMQFNPILNQRAGLHNHVLLDYGSSHSCIEKPVPGLIFKNFMQLVRRHAPELVWITSTVYKRDEYYITRYSKFCMHDTLMQYSPSIGNVTEYIQKLKGSERYKFVNPNPMNSTGDMISKFHFELRFPDGSILPAQIAAQNILYAAMLIKAVELSETGLIKAGEAEDWNETKTLMEQIRNNNFVSERLSSSLTEEGERRIKERALEFIQFMKPTLMHFDKQSYIMLRCLADSPVSMMRRTMEIPEINTYFHNMIQTMHNAKTEDYSNIIKIINTQKVYGCTSKIEWFKKAAETLTMNAAEFDAKIFRLGLIKPMDFDTELGLVYFK